MNFKFIMNALVVALASVASTANAASCVQYYNKLSGIVGVDSTNGVVFTQLISNQNECACVNARFQPANTDVKMILSVLLSAKLTDRLVRVDFLDINSCDSAYRVYVY